MMGISFIVDNMKVVFTEKDIPMLKDAIKSLKLQVRLNKNMKDANCEESEVTK